MGQYISALICPRTRIDPKTGMMLYKVLDTKHRNTVSSLRIQPAGDLLVAADEFGCLLLFDLSSQTTIPQQSRQLLPEHGGVSDLCWIADDIIAVGTTRGKIIIYSSRNKTGRFYHVCDVDAHGDGVSQVAVEGLDFSPATHRLVSVGDGRHCIKLWNVDENGILSPHPTGEQLPEYSVPRFVGFANDGAEIVVGYLEHAVVRHFEVEPWKLLARKQLNRREDLDIMPSSEGRVHHYIGNALLLPHLQQLAVFNLQNGLDVHGFPNFNLKHRARFNIDPRTSQGVAIFKSGTLLASPTKEGNINVFNSHDLALVTTLRSNTHSLIQAIDVRWITYAPDQHRLSLSLLNFMQARSIPSRKAEFLVGASSRNGRDTTVAVWRNQTDTLDEIHNLRNTASASFSPSSNSFARQVILGIFIYLLCSLVQPMVLKFASVNTNGLSFALGNQDLFRWNIRQTYPAKEPEAEPSQHQREWKLKSVVQHSLCQTDLEPKPTWTVGTARCQERGLIVI